MDNQSWAVTSDHHGRIYRTVVGAEFGSLQSFRLESMLPAMGETKVVSSAVGSALVSISPGYASSLPLGSSQLLTDRAEAIPRKLQLLLQDDEESFVGFAELLRKYPAPSGVDEGDFKRLTLRIPRSVAHPYRTQRITIENVSAGLRWSADATSDADAVLEDVLVRTDDRVRIIRNAFTYGVISLFGYGVGLYDLNAIESNDTAAGNSNVPGLREQIRMTRGALEPESCPAHPPDADGVITDLTFAPEAGVVTQNGSPQLSVLGLDPHRGIADVLIDPSQSEAGVCTERVSGGLVFRSASYDHPRLAALRERFFALAGRYPSARFNSLAYYRWRLEAADNKAVRGPVTSAESSLPGQRGSLAGEPVTRDYFLLPGNEYGLLVVEVGGNAPLADGSSFRPLREQSLVDIIWIPGGAYAVRTIPRTNLATVVDGDGRVLLVDLSRIDERFTDDGTPRSGSELFPTVARSLEQRTSEGVGAPDPRILWKSEPHLVSGTLPPVVDPETGMIYAGKLLERQLSVVSATDPRIQIKVDLGDPNGVSEVSGIVPLGLELPAAVAEQIAKAPPERRANASLGVFRLEVTLPGGMTEALPEGRLKLFLRSETVIGVPADFAGSILPAAAMPVELQRIVPGSIEMASKLRHQRGFNRFVSPWIVAIGDPRASERFDWKGATTASSREVAGCYNCMRPVSLRGNAAVPEIFSSGRILAVVPSIGAENPFAGTAYSYLGSDARLAARFATVPADTVRAPEVLSAAQNPAVASGALMSSHFVHSGEMSTSAIDLDAGGRAGWNVVIDRTYRSRSIGGSPFGMGWESSIFRRLRPLPNGDVEYRDGSGEIWRFVKTTRTLGGAGTDIDTFRAPKGLFLRLSRTDRGWLLTDQKWRATHFDSVGRLTMESDEFRAPRIAASGGNVVHYFYDANGRLARIVDPVGRESTVEYFDEGTTAGLVRKISDWREGAEARSIEYVYDGARRLREVLLPNVSNTSNVRPTIRYGYAAVATSFNDRLELEANLASITDPGETAARVSWMYNSDALRDRVHEERWATGEKAVFSYSSPVQTIVTDALGQARTYDVAPAASSYNSDRPHVTTLVESAVKVAKTPFGSLPDVALPSAADTSTLDRKHTAVHDEHGLIRVATLDGVRETTNTWGSVEPVAPGFVLRESVSRPIGGAAAKSTATFAGEAITQRFGYQSSPFGVALLESVKRGNDLIEMKEPSSVFEGAGNPLSTFVDGVTSRTTRQHGLPTSIVSSGGTDANGTGVDVRIDYADVTAAKVERGLPKKIQRGDLATTLRYDANTIAETDARGVTTTTALDSWRRPVRVTVSGDGVKIDLAYEYDAKGQLRKTTRRQGTEVVTTSFEYDILGRTTKVTTDQVAVDGAKTSVSTTTVHEVGGKRLTTISPGGAVTTTELDSLGRTVKTSTTTTTAGDPIHGFVAYDIDDNPVHVTDLFTGTASAYDIHGREVASRFANGTANVTTFDSWNRPRLLEQRDGSGQLIGEMTIAMRAGGTVESVSTKIDEQTASTTSFAWDAAGRTTRMASGSNVAGERAFARRMSSSGKLLSTEAGGGSLEAITDVFSRSSTDTASYSGGLPLSVQSGEKGGDYRLGFDYDNAGNLTTQTIGSLESRWRWDEGGNLVAAKAPNRPEATFERDARGALTKDTLPDGATIARTYSAIGSPASYIDQAGEKTETKTDLIGRPTLRTYSDSTTESWTWDGPRLKSYKDRQNRVRTLEYDLKGQVSKIYGNGNQLLETIDRDGAGRVKRRSNRGSAIEFEGFNLAGLPRTTRQIRYKDGSGFDAKEILDSFEQTHTWNEHAERASVTMPSYSGMNASPGWTRS
ncbi:MAG: DUF6531 domain-containing protein, partial [Thermoanaerobaculia bacterium]|nr:DUF6531 domain-containing protein [Thermoanaerobaculia bacterium]